jgi:hypothetical protein
MQLPTLTPHVLALLALSFLAPAAAEPPTDAVVVSHLFPACNGHRAGGHKARHVPVDACLTTPGFGMRIMTPAVCANGTRALWARFSDGKCNKGVVDPVYGLKEIRDADVGECLSTAADEGENIRSMSFWCQGFKSTPFEGDGGEGGEGKGKDDEPAEKLKPAPGSVSESACMVGKAPFFQHPKTDTCTDLQTAKMKIFSTGVCADGKRARMALYETKGCAGEPKELKSVPDSTLKTCWDLQGRKSFAFWCTGEGLGEAPVEDKPGNGGQKQSGGSIVLTLLLICLMLILMLALSVWAWFQTNVGKFVRVSYDDLDEEKISRANDLIGFVPARWQWIYPAVRHNRRCTICGEREEGRNFGFVPCYDRM